MRYKDGIVLKFSGPWQKAAGIAEFFFETADPITLADLVEALEDRYGRDFGSHGEGLVCIFEDEGPRAIKHDDPVFPGATLLFLGTVESG
ncbi:MAG: hypothetical protein Q7I97_08210 [Thermovirgaceae bacterium]|nr:hypothetical protein [Thermovirgaceae bacterium]